MGRKEMKYKKKKKKRKRKKEALSRTMVTIRTVGI